LSLFRWLKPATLAARIFWGVAAASLISAVAIWGWLYTRFYESLDREASFRMKQMAESLLFEVRRVQPAENDHALRRTLISHFWGLEASAGMVQNLYWLDLSGPRPSFIASFSSSTDGVAADNGPGIPAAIAEQLFTPFVSGSAEGNGFGLAISRKLVEAHGGEIYHEKNTDSGAVFVIEVPQA